jgi:23S rRNA (guanosine2251-2'-O)-methyltransferase
MPYLDNRNSIIERLKEQPDRSVRLWVEAGFERVSSFAMDEAHRAGISIRVIPKDQFQNKMKGAKSHVLLETEEFRYLDQDTVLSAIPQMPSPVLFCAFDGIFDPQNLGNVIRTASCFHLNGVFIPKDHACGVTDIVVNVARGGTDHIPISRVSNMARYIEELKKRNVFCFGLDEKAEKTIHHVDLTMPLCLVLGGEDGLRRLVRDRCDLLVKLPTNPAFPSLNVANAFAIAAYETARQRAAKTHDRKTEK